jgi:hypothetical protein
MLRRRAHQEAIGDVVAIGPPTRSDLDARLDEALARGRPLAEAAQSVRSQRDYERWKNAVLEWRTTTAETLETGFTTPAARDALLELWLSSAPLCAVWPDSLKAERATLDAALDFAQRIREATAPTHA